MINYVKRKHIDEQKYNTCIEKSLQSRVYAYTWYLDVVADNWDALVLDDYQAVMPMPWKRKCFIKYICQPYFTQQLGVFSLKKMSLNTIDDFIKKIPKTFIKVRLQLNSENTCNSANVESRNNYILPLNNEYGELLKGFSSIRKRTLKKNRSFNLILNQKVAPDVFLDFILKVPLHYKLNRDQITVLKKIVLSGKIDYKIWGAEYDKKMVALVLWVFDNKRITYLFPINTNIAKKIGASSFLINALIKQYANSNYILDFEGSMISSIAYFFKSFGSEKETYLYLKQ
ncbi:hypothetical protein [Tenacibaculum sp. UWU-22]|uniref:hypothetical protein n=1 Tax=Tenacibaculum sp. UWU-22 TaxID=3234187 RepID=UPI0034DAE1E7